MAFSINTNIASLQAQNYLRVNSNFQQKTINKVTSGLRIVNSGDDAAGLAIANGMRSDEAVLNQGVRNANDGLSQLQIADGGMSNISQLLDRARTIATQSASDTYTGDRGVLNKEFQSVMTEIDRQAQAIGLNKGGTFAKSLSVFIGGGKADGTGSASSVITNGSVAVDLSKSTVDTQSLGIKGFTAGYQKDLSVSGTTDTGLYDLGSGSATSVKILVADAVNNTRQADGSVKFVFAGAGFSDTNSISINANLSNVSDTNSLVTSVNNAIANAAAQGSQSANAFKAAGVIASVHTGADGHQQLVFSSSTSAFQVEAGDKLSNAFMGNLVGNTAGASASATPVGKALDDTSDFQAGGAAQYSAVYTTGLIAATPENQAVTFTSYDASGSPSSTTINVLGASAVGANLTAAEFAQQINTALQSTDNPSLQKIVAVANQAGDGITFESSGTRFEMTIGVNTGAAGHGIKASSGTTQGVIVSGTATGVSANSDISNQTSAKAAVTALSTATSALGSAQAVVGRGQNQFNYAINLAQSQVTNMAAAESQIRDADLAAESANLTKAQILIQAGVAALAQANSAPQQVLTLLQR